RTRAPRRPHTWGVCPLPTPPPIAPCGRPPPGRSAADPSADLGAAVTSTLYHGCAIVEHPTRARSSSVTSSADPRRARPCDTQDDDEHEPEHDLDFPPEAGHLP